jgi:hypothetical protein
MRTVGLLAIAAALTMAGVAAWAASGRGGAQTGDRIDVTQITMNAPSMPTEELVDYTFVF